MMIETRDLKHSYGDIQALSGIDLSIPEGSFFALLGPNGAGKSTLVSILSTLQRASAGTAQVAGFDVRKHASKVREVLGMVFQEPSLDERLTLLENLEFHGWLYKVPKKERFKRAVEVLQLVELEEWGNALVRSLSRGMKRRVEIARAVMHHPRLLILDEPTSGLDVQSRRRIWEYLQALNQQGISMLLTTHQIEEAEHADWVAIVDKGKIVVQDTPLNLKAAMGEQVVSVRFKTPQQAQIAAQSFDTHIKGAEVRFYVSDPQTVLAVLNFAEVLNLEINYPSLEDVFVHHTGRALRDEGGERSK